MLTPLDVQKRLFKKSVRGYSCEEVDEFMELISNTLEKHINENAMLKEKLDKRDEEIKRYRTLENTLSDTLVVAKQTSEDLVDTAKREAQNIIYEAQLNAQKIHEQSDRALNDKQKRGMGMEEDMQAFKARLEAMLKAQLDLVSKYNIDLK